MKVGAPLQNILNLQVYLSSTTHSITWRIRGDRVGLLLLCLCAFFVSTSDHLDDYLLRSLELIEWKLAVVGGNSCPAEWAVGVALEPSVDAVHMEDMEAARQEPDPLLFLELTDAHSTLAGVSSVLLDGLPVPESRQRLDGRLLQPPRLGHCREAAGGGTATTAAGDEAGRRRVG